MFGNLPNVSDLTIKYFDLNHDFNIPYEIKLEKFIIKNKFNELISFELDKDFEIRKPKYASFRQGDVRHSLADINKAKTLLGYEPQIRVREGIIKTVNRHLKVTT